MTWVVGYYHPELGSNQGRDDMGGRLLSPRTGLKPGEG